MLNQFHSVPIPQNIPTFEDESDKEESEPKRLKPTVRSESESSEISVIISLPSTDSIDKMDIKPVIKKFGDFSNSEYESFDEERN